MERLNLTWLDWPVFVAVIVLGTGTCLVLMGIGIAWDLWDHFRANRIYELNRRKQ